MTSQYEDSEQEQDEEEQEDDEEDAQEKTEESIKQKTDIAEERTQRETTGTKSNTNKRSKAKKTGSSSRLANKSVERTAAARTDDLRQIGRCAGCGNILAQSTRLHEQDVKGVKDKIKTGKAQVYLCDDCNDALKAGRPRDLKTAVVTNEDGSINNVTITDLIAPPESTTKAGKQKKSD